MEVIGIYIGIVRKKVAQFGQVVGDRMIAVASQVKIAAGVFQCCYRNSRECFFCMILKIKEVKQ